MNQEDFKWPYKANVLGSVIKQFNKRACRRVLDAVYFIFDRNGNLAYVGKTSSRGIASRITQHAKNEWFDAAFYIETDIGEPYLFEAQWLEQAAIRFFRPYVNKQRYEASILAHHDFMILRHYAICIDQVPEMMASHTAKFPERIIRRRRTSRAA